jgi:metallophosphoesterase superfamily enzyme
MRVLAVGDVHEPVSRKEYLQFCIDTYDEYDCDTVVFLGDIVDWHAISFHANHPEAPSAIDEYYLALEGIQKWYDVFPNAYITIGNHDCRINRLAETVNIPSKFIRDFNETWETPEWEWVDDIILDDVYYFHGTGYGGLHPAFNAARHLGMSCVMGHVHSVAGIKWCVSPEKRWFGMDTGCGVDDKAFAFAYGKHMKRKSVISCGVVIDGMPYHEMCPLEIYK